MNTINIAYLGLGIMGSAMAANLARAGQRVLAWNRTPGRPAARLVAEAGAQVVNSIEQAVEGAEVIFTCLADVPDVEAVLLGAEGVSTYALKGAIVVDMSTIGPRSARHLATQLNGAGLRFLDAPVTGGDAGARSGTLTIMVGGDPETLDACRPLLEMLGKSIHYCGPVGSGQAVKLCNQVLCAINMLAVSEALCLADDLGVERSLVVDVCSRGAGGSWALSNLAQRIIASDLAPGFMIKHILKDLRLVGESVSHRPDRLPATALAQQLFQAVAASDGGAGGELGTQALILAYSDI
ncbi:MAG TPA: NAD(P)-dependent oxidoreductase [Candidatus Obscuribacterales bacterium]